jgi:hypothetical protein
MATPAKNIEKCEFCARGFDNELSYYSSFGPRVVRHIQKTDSPETHLFHLGCLSYYLRECNSHNWTHTCPICEKAIVVEPGDDSLLLYPLGLQKRMQAILSMKELQEMY